MNGTSTQWYPVVNDDAGELLNTVGDKVDYRLRKDDTSAIVYHFSPNNIMVDVTYQLDPQDSGPMSIGMYDQRGANYANINAPFKKRGMYKNASNVWANVVLQPIIMNKTMSVRNVECDPIMNFTITTVDANGETLVYNGTDNLGAPIPTALSANVTVTNNVWPSALAVLRYNGIEPISAAFGSGSVKVVP